MCLSVCVCVYMCVRTSVCAGVCVCRCVCVCLSALLFLCTHVYVRVPTCVRACMRVCEPCLDASLSVGPLSFCSERTSVVFLQPGQLVHLPQSSPGKPLHSHTYHIMGQHSMHSQSPKPK